MSKKIKFIDKSNTVHKDFYPKPAKRFLPEWYKKIDSIAKGAKEHLPEGEPDRANHSTVKKCVPVFDSISSGYIIPTFADIFVSEEKVFADENDKVGVPNYYWPETIDNPINFHPYEQIEGYPFTQQGHPMAKFANPWGIRTPRGYSCLITTPSHREIPFVILEAIVDTDRYSLPVEFLFRLRDPNFSGNIPAGTPMVQIIPFKRENWDHEISDLRNTEESASYARNQYLLDSGLKNRYKTRFWDRKHFN